MTELELDLDDEREIAWRCALDSVHRSIQLAEFVRAQFTEWAPRLRDFARECRESTPIPKNDDSARTAGLLRIYEQGFNPPICGPPKIAICTMPLMAMPVAQQVWNKWLDNVVLLTPEEGTQWSQIYQIPKKLHIWWFSLHSYSLDERPERTFRWSIDGSTGKPPRYLGDETDVPPGCEAWTYSSGMIFGPLAGGGSTHLWLWDGKEPRHIRQLSEWFT